MLNSGSTKSSWKLRNGSSDSRKRSGDGCRLDNGFSIMNEDAKIHVDASRPATLHNGAISTDWLRYGSSSRLAQIAARASASRDTIGVIGGILYTAAEISKLHFRVRTRPENPIEKSANAPRMLGLSESHGTEFGEKWKSYVEKNIDATHEFIKQLSRAKDFEQMMRIDIDFMHCRKQMHSASR